MARGGDYNQVDPSTRPDDKPDSTGFVPDFCEPRAVLTVLIVAQLLAVLLSVAPGRPLADLWSRLGITSFFILWVALLSAGVLCSCRPYLARLSAPAASAAAFVLLEGIVVGATLAAELLIRSVPALGFAAAPLTDRLVRNAAVAGIVNAVLLRYLHLQYSLRERLAEESKARLQALQARIRPHFLFNSLNTILSLIRSDPAAAEQATEGLADLFRASLRETGPLTTLAQELALCRSYLEIEQLRLGERLAVDWALDAVPDQLLLPPLVLQPLLENAIYHGIEPLQAPGTIQVSGAVDGNHAVLVIRNPLAPSGRTNRTGQQLALDNISARMRTHFGRRGGLTVATLDDTFIATLTLPLAPEA